MEADMDEDNGNHRWMFDPGDSEYEDTNREIYQRLHESLFGFMGKSMDDIIADDAAADQVVESDDFHENLITFLENIVTGEDEHEEAEAWREENQYNSFPDELDDYLQTWVETVSEELSDSNLENNGSNSYEGDYYEDDELLDDYDSYFDPQYHDSLFDLAPDFNRDMENALDYARERDAEAEAEQNEDGDDEVLTSSNHPRHLWGAEEPEDAVAPKQRGPIDRMKDGAIRGVEGAIRGVGGAAYQAVQNMPNERRQKIMQDPRAQAAYQAVNNMNLRGQQPGSPDPDAEGDDRWRGSTSKSYRDDHTNFGLDFHNNPLEEQCDS